MNVRQTGFRLTSTALQLVYPGYVIGLFHMVVNYYPLILWLVFAVRSCKDTRLPNYQFMFSNLWFWLIPALQTHHIVYYQPMFCCSSNQVGHRFRLPRNTVTLVLAWSKSSCLIHFWTTNPLLPWTIWCLSIERVYWPTFSFIKKVGGFVIDNPKIAKRFNFNHRRPKNRNPQSSPPNVTPFNKQIAVHKASHHESKCSNSTATAHS